MIKRTALVFGFTLAFSAPGYAQIPVTDGVHIATSIANQVESVAKYAQQITQLKQQLQQTQATYNSLHGLRDVGSLMNNELVKQNMPPEYQKALNALKDGKGGSLSGISGSLNDIVKKNQARACSDYDAPNMQAQCKAKWQANAMNQYVGESGYEQSAKNIQNLQQFVDKIQSTPDAKGLQDLQARINVEQVKLQNEQMKLNTIQQMQKAKEEMERTNAIDNTVKSLKPGTIRFN
jgi:type IV secretion system protein VirB5